MEIVSEGLVIAGRQAYFAPLEVLVIGQPSLAVRPDEVECLPRATPGFVIRRGDYLTCRRITAHSTTRRWKCRAACRERSWARWLVLGSSLASVSRARTREGVTASTVAVCAVAVSAVAVSAVAADIQTWAEATTIPWTRGIDVMAVVVVVVHVPRSRSLTQPLL